MLQLLRKQPLCQFELSFLSIYLLFILNCQRYCHFPSHFRRFSLISTKLKHKKVASLLKRQESKSIEVKFIIKVLHYFSSSSIFLQQLRKNSNSCAKMEDLQSNKIEFYLLPSNWYFVPIYSPLDSLQNRKIENYDFQDQYKMMIKLQTQYAQIQANNQNDFLQHSEEPENQTQIFHNQNLKNKISHQKEDKKQKKGRNIFSNIFRSFLKYLSSKQYFQDYFLKVRKEISKQQFTQKLRNEVKKFQNYVKREQIFTFFRLKVRSNPEEEYNNIVTSSLTFYLEKKHLETILCSKKISPNSQKLHIKQLNSFMKVMKKIMNQNGQEGPRLSA